MSEATKEASRLIAILVTKALIVAACWRIPAPYFIPAVWLLWMVDGVGWTLSRRKSD